MNRTSGRIEIPQNVGEMLNLASAVYQKHLQDGASSPLNSIDGLDWAAVGPTIVDAQAANKLAESLKMKMEIAYRQRDALTPQIVEALKMSRNLLKALNQGNPKRLGDWGFTVDDSFQVKK